MLNDRMLLTLINNLTEQQAIDFLKDFFKDKIKTYNDLVNILPQVLEDLRFDLVQLYYTSLAKDYSFNYSLTELYPLIPLKDKEAFVKYCLNTVDSVYSYKYIFKHLSIPNRTTLLIKYSNFITTAHLLSDILSVIPFEERFDCILQFKHLITNWLDIGSLMKTICTDKYEALILECKDQINFIGIQNALELYPKEKIKDLLLKFKDKVETDFYSYKLINLIPDQHLIEMILLLKSKTHKDYLYYLINEEMSLPVKLLIFSQIKNDLQDYALVKVLMAFPLEYRHKQFCELNNIALTLEILKLFSQDDRLKCLEPPFCDFYIPGNPKILSLLPFQNSLQFIQRSEANDEKLYAAAKKFFYQELEQLFPTLPKQPQEALENFIVRITEYSSWLYTELMHIPELNQFHVLKIISEYIPIIDIKFPPKQQQNYPIQELKKTLLITKENKYFYLLSILKMTAKEDRLSLVKENIDAVKTTTQVRSIIKFLPYGLRSIFIFNYLNLFTSTATIASVIKFLPANERFLFLISCQFSEKGIDNNDVVKIISSIPTKEHYKFLDFTKGKRFHLFFQEINHLIAPIDCKDALTRRIG